MLNMQICDIVVAVVVEFFINLIAVFKGYSPTLVTSMAKSEEEKQKQKNKETRTYLVNWRTFKPCRIFRDWKKSMN